MRLRTITITAVLSCAAACGDELLDLGEEQMRIIAQQLRSVTSGARVCKETARQTTHARLHMSPAELDQVSDLHCVSMPTELVCRGDYCTCSSEGEADTDGNYRAECTHTKDGKSTAKSFTFSELAVATFAAQEGQEERPEPATPNDVAPSPTPVSSPNTPAETTESALCGTNEADTLKVGEQLLRLASEDPLFVSDFPFATLVCGSEERGDQRNLRCVSETCVCTATFRLNAVPSQASCERV